jgi:hypothetical protein
MIVDDVLLRLSGAELAFLRHSLQGPGEGPGEAPADGVAWQETEERLRRRRLVARAADSSEAKGGAEGGAEGGARRLQIDPVAVALVGTWLRPTTGVRVALSTGGPPRLIDLFHLEQLTVEHEQEGDEHVFRPHSSGPALAGRLGVLAGLAGQPRPASRLEAPSPQSPRPPGERLWLSRATVEALWEAAGQSGAAGVRRVLARERGVVPAPAARALAAALEEPQRVLRLEVFEARRGGAGSRAGALVSTGGLRLVEGAEGYWAFSTGPGDGGVDVRPVSSAEAGALLTVLAGAVFRPLPGAVAGPASRPGQSET